MPKLTQADRRKYLEYIREAEQSRDNLEFLLDNLGAKGVLDYSIESLEKAEACFWDYVNSKMPPELSDEHHFAHLLGQYLGQCIIHHSGAAWVQSETPDARLAQPCIDGFGGQEWDRIYPVDLALHIGQLPVEKPYFPGVRGRRVFAQMLENALAIHVKREGENLGE